MSSVPLNNNVPSLNAQRRLAESTSSLSRTFERLSSGLRINKASDDAAGLSISESLKTDARVFLQAVKNLNDGISVLNTADGAMNELSNIVVRLRELATQASNGTLKGSQRGSLDKEAQALAKEFNRIARSTSFNGMTIFDGTSSDTVLQAGYSQLAFNFGGAVGNGTFGSRQAYGTGGTPETVVTADFNGDGKLDLATADGGSNSVSVLLGNGDGSFQSRKAFATGSFPFFVASADFDVDGIADLVTADRSSDAVSVLLGNGDGSFRSKQAFATGSLPLSVATTDFNADGKTDLVTADQSSNSVSVLLGNGDGTFQSRLAFVTDGSPISVATGDFDSDGISDLVVTGNSSTAAVLLGNGNGTFKSKQSFATGSLPFSIVVGDFNGDGVSDLATADYNSGGGSTASVLLGNGNGTFRGKQLLITGAGPRSVSVSDFNGDGNTDLVTADRSSNAVSVLLGNGDGTFRSRRAFSTGSAPFSVATGDFDGDGVTDLVTADSGSNAVSVLLGASEHGISNLQPFSLATREASRSAMTYFFQVQTRITSQQGTVGAFASRAQYAISTLRASSEEYSVAESRVRDADTAEESAQLVKSRILQQAGAAILASANQQPRLVLELLGGIGTSNRLG